MTFFVPDLTTEDGQKLAYTLISNILSEQFDISYYVKGISWTDTENMSVIERREIYNRLLKRKTEEREAMEEANKKAKSGVATSSSSRSSRRIRR
jgi:hypothetical protein